MFCRPASKQSQQFCNNPIITIGPRCKVHNHTQTPHSIGDFGSQGERRLGVAKKTRNCVGNFHSVFGARFQFSRSETVILVELPCVQPRLTPSLWGWTIPFIELETTFEKGGWKRPEKRRSAAHPQLLLMEVGPPLQQCCPELNK
jgi:hypothetical protein